MKFSFFRAAAALLFCALAPAAPCAIAAGSTAAGDDVAGANAKWTPLFNGKNLSGWVKRGGNAPFTVENGEIVGTVVAGTPNTFLCTTRNYADFILELEFNCHRDVNSGVQIRSEYNAESKLFGNLPPLPGKARKRKEYRSKPNHVAGYQVEIEFAPGRTGGIYDEDRRHGWVFPAQGTAQDEAFRKQGRDPAVIKPGEWQKLRVVARGDSLRTYIDGVLRADARDNASAVGLIALQVHSAGPRDNGKTVRFRNIRLLDLTRQQSSTPAANAK